MEDSAKPHGASVQPYKRTHKGSEIKEQSRTRYHLEIISYYLLNFMVVYRKVEPGHVVVCLVAGYRLQAARLLQAAGLLRAAGCGLQASGCRRWGGGRRVGGGGLRRVAQPGETRHRLNQLPR